MLFTIITKQKQNINAFDNIFLMPTISFNSALLVYILVSSVAIVYLVIEFHYENTGFVDDAPMEERWLEGPREVEHAWQEFQRMKVRITIHIHRHGILIS